MHACIHTYVRTNIQTFNVIDSQSSVQTFCCLVPLTFQDFAPIPNFVLVVILNSSRQYRKTRQDFLQPLCLKLFIEQ